MAFVSDQAIRKPGPLREGWRIQRRVIGALILRELHTRYGRENIGYLWVVLEPLMLATMIGLIHARSPSHFGSDLKPVPLALIGYCNFITFRSIVNRAEGAMEGSATLLYHRTISLLDILISRALLEIGGTWIAFMLLISASIVIGVSNPPERPLYVLLGMVLMGTLSFSCGLVVTAATHDNRSLGRLVHPLSYILMPLSGAFFTMEMLPPSLRAVFLYIPLAHIFELLRYGWFKAATPEYIDPLFLAEWILGSLLLGLLLLSRMRARIHMS